MQAICVEEHGDPSVLSQTDAERPAHNDTQVRIDAVGRANDSHVVHQRSDPTVLGAAATARRAAAADASIDLAAVDVVELHDMFTILELLQLEALGFADHGEGWRLIERGDTNRDGPLPVNTSGGLKAKGHPIAASGIAQCVELFDQLLGQAGSRQVDAESGLACNIGGFGNSCLVTVLTTP